MPTYEYRCANGHDFEEFYLRMSAAKSELPCPTCGLPGGRRMSAGGGLLFKGSGFYITDYGKDGKKGAPTPTGTSDRGAGDAGEGSRNDGARAEGPKSESAASESSKSESSKSESSKSGSSKSDAARSESSKSESKPATAPAIPPAKGGE
ncbi:MAG: FmdB family transcriptional regulator [Gemmatimonas sp.]|nr:FmdB family transcriptional regulator [Gemmatimonas sp.]